MIYFEMGGILNFSLLDSLFFILYYEALPSLIFSSEGFIQNRRYKFSIPYKINWVYILYNL